MRTVNLVLTFDDKKSIERFKDSDSAIVRFEEAKYLNGVKSLLMTFADGSSWRWKKNEPTVHKQHSSLASLISDAERQKSQIGDSSESKMQTPKFEQYR